MMRLRHTRSLAALLGAIALLYAAMNSADAEQAPGGSTTRVFFVFFTTGDDQVRPAYENDLKEAACHAADRVRILVRGYADRTGTPADNQLLSQRRAISVAGHLARFGISCDKPVEIVGLGEEDAPGQAKYRPFSRRVDVALEGTLPSPERVVQCLRKLEYLPQPDPLPQCSKRP
jgi:outer membrane protein OmpA-like peptidoglycan-associated protein